MSDVIKTSIKQQVYEIIKEKIINQEYALGEQINIKLLGEELEVSNTPIREALARLNAEGLVSSSHNLKFRVVEFSPASYYELNQTVAVLEIGAFDSANELGLIDELAAMLEERLDAQRETLDNKDYDGFIRKAIEFDRSFLAVLKNKTLLSVFDELSNLLFLAVRYNHQKSGTNRESNVAEHEDILAAVKRRDTAKVKARLRSHYDKRI